MSIGQSGRSILHKGGGKVEEVMDTENLLSVYEDIKSSIPKWEDGRMYMWKYILVWEEE